MACRVTSGPIPSPSMTTMCFFISRGLGQLLFKLFDLAPDAQKKVDIVVSVEQAGLFIIIDLKIFLFAGGQADRLGFKVDIDLCGRVFLDGGKGLLEESVADGYRQQEVIKRVILENVGEEAAYHHVESGVFDGPCSVLAA